MKLKHITVCGILLSSLVFGACSVDGHHSEHHSKHTQTEKVKSHHKDADKHKKHDSKKKHHDNKHDKQADQKNKDTQNQQAQQQQANNQPQPGKGAGGDHYNDVDWGSNGPYGVNARTYYANGRIHSTDPWIDSQYVENINNGNWNPDGTDTVQGYINEYHQEPGRGSDDVCPN